MTGMISIMIKAVIFDMDGVIVDSEPMYARANAAALEEFGLSMPAGYYLGYAGTSKYNIMKTLIEQHGIDATVSELCAAADAQYSLLLKREGFTEVPGVCNFIKKLIQSNLRLAVASSSRYDNIYSVLDYFHLIKYFEVILSGSDENVRPKPAPDIYIKAVNALNIIPSEAAAIEDTDTGLQSAHSAGLLCYAYRNKNSGNQSLTLAHKVINDYNMIVDYDYKFII